MFCRKCGTEIDMTLIREDGTVECTVCGAVYRSKSAAQPPKQEQKHIPEVVEDQPTSSKSTTVKMLFCKKCGTELSEHDRMSDGSVECPNCGTIFRSKSAKSTEIVKHVREPEPDEYDVWESETHRQPGTSPKTKESKGKGANLEKVKAERSKKPSKPKRVNSSHGKPNSNHPKHRITLILVVILIMASLCIAVLLIMGKLRIKQSDELPTLKDAKDYYNESGQIVEIIKAGESSTVSTEAEVIDELVQRGFEQYATSSQYSMDGNYTDPIEATSGSSDKHPMYITQYVSEAGEVWTIYEINGNVMANPVSYNLNSGLKVQVIVSESRIVTSYDSATNSFYDTIPNESALIVKVVKKIDAETLNGLTAEVLGGL